MTMVKNGYDLCHEIVKRHKKTIENHLKKHSKIIYAYVASQGNTLIFRIRLRRQMPLFGLYRIFHSSDFFSRSSFSFSPEPDFVSWNGWR
jgi:hypothetical protein